MGYRTAFALLLAFTTTTAPAEWEGAPSDDYWWPYSLYLALLWIVPIGYGLLGWLLDWWRTRRAIRISRTGRDGVCRNQRGGRCER